MDFDFNEEQELLRARTRALLEAESPISEIRARLDAPTVFDRDLWRKGASLGWLGMLAPTWSGSQTVTDQPLVDLVVVVEELGRHLQPGPYIPTNVVAHAITQAGTAEQRRAHLPRIVSGDVVATWCIAEEAGWDPAAIRMMAEPSTEAYVLNGRKRFVEDGEAADLFLVTARVDGSLAQFLVPRSSPGIEVSRLDTIDVTRRLHDVRFNSVVVPTTAMLSARGASDAVVEDQLRIAIVLQCAESAAGASALVAMSTEYAKQRAQFGRAVGSFQAIKHKLAEAHLAAHSATCAAHYAAMAVADGQPDAAIAVAVAKIFVPAAYARVAGEALQVHGGRGFTWESDVHLFLRRAKSNQALLGGSDEHREQLCDLLGA